MHLVVSMVFGKVFPMKVQVCRGNSCTSRGSAYVVKRLEGDIERLELSGVELEDCLCQGNCQKGPTILIDGTLIFFANPVVASTQLKNRLELLQSKYSLK